ncbi:MAG TPA: hypothetical protein VH761_10085, partial [Ilumatobacteraceae bacterium]
MIDDVIDDELELMLRTTLGEMIPKLTSADVQVTRASAVRPRPTRALIALGLVAAIVVALVGIATRDSDRGPTTDTTPPTTGVPPWYAPLRSAVPERFGRLALTLVTETQIWFAALDERDGKALEIQLSLEPLDLTDVISRDATGRWEQTGEGYRVVTPDQFMVTVSCDIGARGRDFEGPPHYCEMASTAAFTMSEIHSVAAAVARAFDKRVFTTSIGTPITAAIDYEHVKALIAAAVPTQHLLADTDWGPGDRVFDYAVTDLRPDTSVRIVHGVYPRPPTLASPQFALYDDAAAGWFVTTEGLAIRISTTDPSPESVERLRELMLDIASLDATLSPPTTYVVATTTTTTTADTPAVDVSEIYRDSATPMPTWPNVGTSANLDVNGYGLEMCDSSTWTKFAAVTSANGTEHEYAGTLCTFTALDQEAHNASASCSSITEGTHYALCRAVPAATLQPSTGTIVGPPAGVGVPVLHGVGATPSDLPPVFGDVVSASDAAGFDDGVARVTLTRGEEDRTCFMIAIANATS